MKTNEFAYWLQGYFELSENVKALSDNQIECIKKHIELVRAVEKDRAGPFIGWLEGVLDAFEAVIQPVHTESEDGTSKSIDLNWEENPGRQKFTAMIKERLDGIFEHKIDDSYGKDLSKLDAEDLKNKLDQIHNPPSRPNWPGVMRC